MIDKLPLRQPPLLWLILSSLLAILGTVITMLPACALGDEEVFASIGTGELNGIYYPVSEALCLIVSRDLRTYGVRCSPEATPGSVYKTWCEHASTQYGHCAARASSFRASCCARAVITGGRYGPSCIADGLRGSSSSRQCTISCSRITLRQSKPPRLGAIG